MYYWFTRDYMWKVGLSKKDRYESARHMAYFSELLKQFPCHVVQKRNGK